MKMDLGRMLEFSFFREVNCDLILIYCSKRHGLSLFLVDSAARLNLGSVA